MGYPQGHLHAGQGKGAELSELEGEVTPRFLSCPLPHSVPGQGPGWWSAWSPACYLSHRDSTLLQSGTAGKEKLPKHLPRGKRVGTQALLVGNSGCTGRYTTVHPSPALPPIFSGLPAPPSELCALLLGHCSLLPARRSSPCERQGLNNKLWPSVIPDPLKTTEK